MIKNFKILIFILSLLCIFKYEAQDGINWISWDKMIELREIDTLRKYL